MCYHGQPVISFIFIWWQSSKRKPSKRKPQPQFALNRNLLSSWAGLRFMSVFLCQPPECWDYRWQACAPTPIGDGVSDLSPEKYNSSYHSMESYERRVRESILYSVHICLISFISRMVSVLFGHIHSYAGSLDPKWAVLFWEILEARKQGHIEGSGSLGHSFEGYTPSPSFSVTLLPIHHELNSFFLLTLLSLWHSTMLPRKRMKLIGEIKPSLSCSFKMLVMAILQP